MTVAWTMRLNELSMTKKLTQRREILALLALGTLMFLLGFYFWWQSNTYVDLEARANSVETLGKTAYAADCEALLPERPYRRHCRGVALLFILSGGLTLAGLARKLQRRADLERAWERAVSSPQTIEDLRCYPQLYPPGFRQWLKAKHPGVLS